MINIKTPQEIEIMAKGGKILSSILNSLKLAVKPGLTTQELDDLAVRLVKENGVKPAFLGYGGFPATLCVSLNDQVVHGLPSERIIQEGDIVSLDMGIIHEGLITDSALTLVALDKISKEEWISRHPKENELINTTRQCLEIGISKAKVGARISDIGRAIQGLAEGRGFGVVRELVGHGVGKKLHEEPQIPNYLDDDGGLRLQAGMVIAIEPMITLGGWQVVRDKDGFSYETKDKSPSAHFEHSVAITKSGPQILTH